MRALYFLPCAAQSGYITMKIVIAPDSYKESLSATEVAQAIEKGFREIFPDAQYVSVPVADGGEGTCEGQCCSWVFLTKARIASLPWLLSLGWPMGHRQLPSTYRLRKSLVNLRKRRWLRASDAAEEPQFGQGVSFA